MLWDNEKCVKNNEKCVKIHKKKKKKKKLIHALKYEDETLLQK